MRLKKIWCIVLFFLYSLLHIVPVFAQEGASIEQADLSQEEQQQIINYQVDFFDWDEINRLQDQLKQTKPNLHQFNLKEEVLSMIQGKKRFSLYEVIRSLGFLLFEEIGIFIQLGIRFILIVLLCNLLETLSIAFKNKNTTKVCFFVCYIVVLYSVIQSFWVMVHVAQNAMDQMAQIMFACVPSLLAFMSTSGYVSTASAIAPMIIGGLNLSTYVINHLILPCIISVVVLDIISTMSEEFKIDKLIGLFYRGMKWVLSGIVIISVGVLGIYKAMLPYVDTSVKKAALSLSTTFIPVIGDVVGGVVDFAINCSMLVKNAFSAGVIIWIILIVALPLIKILAYVIIYHVSAAVIEPIGNKKMAHIATRLAKGCEFIMSCVGIITILCIISLFICISVGGNMI